VVAVAGAEPVVVPAVPVDAVDTTGAGDVHTGVFLAGLLRGASAPEAARRANAVAARWVATGSYGG
jgi:sugar/nucleoside kinase (ribokinase family)